MSRVPIDRPLPLRADNFTPPTRTPWGGTRLLDDFKAGLDLAPEKARYPVVGESWEVSVDPAFPSLLAGVGPDGEDVDLRAAIAADPPAFLGPSSERYDGSTPILVKLLDADDELSVQIHPSDDYDGLEPGESGKPESWIVVGAEAGAGLYLGLTEGVTRASLAAALDAGEDLQPMLNFVPVEPGDAFVIEPGTIHAIGRGVTLVEPQLIVPGRSGKTYRFWDWNRRYDARGQRSDQGQPRELHVEHSLAVTRFDGPRGDAFVATTRARPETLDTADEARRERLLRLQDMTVERFSGDGVIDTPARDTMLAVTVVRGRVELVTVAGALEVERGASCVVPAAAGAVRWKMSDGAEAIVSAIDGDEPAD